MKEVVCKTFWLQGKRQIRKSTAPFLLCPGPLCLLLGLVQSLLPEGLPFRREMAQQVPRDLVLLGFYHSFTMQASLINILIMVVTILHVGYNVPQNKATLNAFAGLGESYLSPSLGKGHKPENTVLGPELSSLIPSCPEENIPPSTGLQHMADAEL